MFGRHLLVLTITSLLLLTNALWAQPQKGNIWLGANIGYGFHASGLAGDEKDFVRDGEFKVTPSGSNKPCDIDYHYLGYLFGLTVQKQMTDVFALGLNYQYHITQQSIWGDEYSRISDWETFITLNQVGPVFTRWINIRNILWLDLSASLNYVTGTLNRVPVLVETLDKFPDSTPAFEQLMEMYNDDLDCSGYGISIEAYLVSFAQHNLMFRYGLRMDFARVSVDDDLFQMTDDAGIFNIELVLGIGLGAGGN